MDQFPLEIWFMVCDHLHLRDFAALRLVVRIPVCAFYGNKDKLALKLAHAYYYRYLPGVPRAPCTETPYEKCTHAQVIRFFIHEFGVRATMKAARGGALMCNFIFSHSAKYGHLDVLMLLREELGFTTQDARTFTQVDCALVMELRIGLDGFVRAQMYKHRYRHHRSYPYFFSNTRTLLKLALQGPSLFSPLQDAAIRGHAHVLRYLKDGFHLDAHDVRLCSSAALRCCVENGHAQALLVLKDVYGITCADVEATGALEDALVRKQFAVAKVLIEEFGVEVPPLMRLVCLRSSVQHHNVPMMNYFRTQFQLTAKEVCYNLYQEAVPHCDRPFFDRHFNARNVMQLALASGSTKVLDCLMNDFGVTLDEVRLNLANVFSMNIVCVNGHAHVLKYLHEKGVNRHDIMHGEPMVLVTAAQHGHLAVVEYLVKHMGFGYTDYVLSAIHHAAAQGKLAVLTFLADTFKVPPLKLTEIYQSLMFSGHLKVPDVRILRFLSDRCCCPPSEHEEDLRRYVFPRAALCVDVDVVKFVMEFGKPSKEFCLTNSGEMGHSVNILKIIHSVHPLTAAEVRQHAPTAVYRAALEGNLDGIKFLRELGLDADDARLPLLDEVLPSTTVTVCARNGRADILAYLQEEYGMGASDARKLNNRALHHAACNGHLNVLICLRAKYGLTAQDARANHNLALRDAAARNHVKVVKYLVNGFGLTLDDVLDCNAPAMAAHMYALEVMDFFVQLGLQLPSE